MSVAMLPPALVVYELSGPAHIAQYLFQIVSQKGVSHPFALFSRGAAQVSLRYPFVGGGEGVLAILRHQKTPIARRPGGYP